MTTTAENKQLSNKWMSDLDFLDSLEFEDKDFLKKAIPIIKVYTYKCPVHLLLDWNAGLDVYVGSTLVGNLKLDANIAPHDTVALIERMIYKFFPGYKVAFGDEVEVDYSAEELAELIKQGKTTIDDAFNLKKRVKHEESGVIERVWIMDDKFKFVRFVNEQKQEELRISKIPLSQFLKEARKLKGENLQNYISLNSKLISTYTPRPVEVRYTGEQLVNFIKINDDGSYMYAVKVLPEGVIYRYGKYVFLLLNEDRDLVWDLVKDKIRTSVIDLGSD